MKDIFPIFSSANKFSTYSFSDLLSLQIILPTRKPSYLSAVKKAKLFVRHMNSMIYSANFLVHIYGSICFPFLCHLHEYFFILNHADGRGRLKFKESKMLCHTIYAIFVNTPLDSLSILINM